MADPRCMSQIRSRDMKPERLVHGRWFIALDFDFGCIGVDLPGSPDLTLARHRGQVGFSLAGASRHWHADPRGAQVAGLPKSNLDYWIPKLTRTRVRDKEHNEALSEMGWRVLDRVRSANFVTQRKFCRAFVDFLNARPNQP